MKSRNYILCLFWAWCGLSTKVDLLASTQTEACIVAEKRKIMQWYKQKRYNKVQVHIEQILPKLTNHEDILELQFLQAYCSFYKKDYNLSADQFTLFIQEYPYASNIEEAIFMRGYSLACIKSQPYLDQKHTFEAMGYLERYLERYPQGNYVDKATHVLKHLKWCLMKKSFEAARLYLRLGYFKAAIVSLKNFERDYPNSVFQEKIWLLFIKSYKALALAASNEQEKQEALAYQRHYTELLASYKKTIE